MGFVGRASLVCGALVGGLRLALLVPVLLVLISASVFALAQAQSRGCGLMATAQPTSGTRSEAAHAATPLTISPSTLSDLARVSLAGRVADACCSPRASVSVGLPMSAADHSPIALQTPSRVTCSTCHTSSAFGSLASVWRRHYSVKRITPLHTSFHSLSPVAATAAVCLS